MAQRGDFTVLRGESLPAPVKLQRGMNAEIKMRKLKFVRVSSLYFPKQNVILTKNSVEGVRL